MCSTLMLRASVEKHALPVDLAMELKSLGADPDLSGSHEPWQLLQPEWSQTHGVSM